MNKQICIAVPSFSAYSETFIRTHIEQLPFDVHVLHGRQLDRSGEDWLLRESRVQRLFRYLLRKFGRFDERSFVADRQAEWLRKIKAEVVLAEYGMTGVKLLDACERAGVPLVVHFHGFDAYNCKDMAPWLEKYRRMFDFAAATIGVSHAMLGRLRELGASETKLHYVPYHVDPKEFTSASPEIGSSVILAVGRFVEKKAPHLTLLAFSKVLREFPSARLEMAGDGPLLGSCRWLVHALGIKNSVVFHGAKEHEWIRQAMRRTTLFVQHSVKAANGDSEGTPVAVLEAQCSGLPVVATHHTGIGDVVVDGETGFLSAEGDVEAMAANMIRVLRMEASEWQQFSMQARRRILENFGPSQTLDRLSEILRRVM